jgi:hypothetical protein
VIYYWLAWVELFFAFICSMPLYAHLRDGNQFGVMIWGIAVALALLSAGGILILRRVIEGRHD